MELNKIHNVDCLDGFKLIKNNSIDLIITSPPYNLNKNYENYSDLIPYSDYLHWVDKWVQESFRVLSEGGRICINVPMESNLNGKKFIMNDYINILEKNDFLRNSLIIWNKQNVTRRTAWGSWKSPSNPNIINPLETIIVYSKNNRKKEGLKINIDITREEFIEYSLGVWNFQPESAKRMKHPAPFPTELPYRCMRMFSYSNDVILDPFMGSGTTAVACINTKRNFIGFEISKEYCDLSNERIKNFLIKKN